MATTTETKPKGKLARRRSSRTRASEQAGLLITGEALTSIARNIFLSQPAVRAYLLVAVDPPSATVEILEDSI